MLSVLRKKRNLLFFAYGFMKDVSSISLKYGEAKFEV